MKMETLIELLKKKFSKVRTYEREIDSQKIYIQEIPYHITMCFDSNDQISFSHDSTDFYKCFKSFGKSYNLDRSKDNPSFLDVYEYIETILKLEQL